jgi:hypothetical protein
MNGGVSNTIPFNYYCTSPHIKKGGNPILKIVDNDFA